MKKISILTYYINVEGLSGDESIAFIKQMKVDAFVPKIEELPPGTIIQWIPVHSIPTHFQVDTIE